MQDKNDSKEDTDCPWETDEVPWRLEQEEGKSPADEGNESDGTGRFDPEEIPHEEAERDGLDTKLKIGFVAFVGFLAVVGVVYAGAAVVADDGEAGIGTSDTGADGEETQYATPEDADGIVALPFEAGATGGDQRLRLRNAGDELETSELRLEVSLPEQGVNATVTNLPTDRLREQENVEGDDIFDRSYGGVGGATTEEKWQGDDIVLRVKHGDDGAEMNPGDSIRVEVTHEPTDEVLFSDSVNAE